VSILVVGERSEALIELLKARGVDAVTADPPLDAEMLAAADVVVLAAEHGGPPPDAAWEVLAAGGILIAPRAEPSQGLQPGIDHLSGGSDRELADLAAMAAAFPTALEPVAAMGRLAAHSRRIATTAAQ
jgi:hypothetical protein